ncbi:hypothetical protein ASPVEDRAFT_302118 [Aspergillus versicolor CBS 583.65]|uniref:GPI anchored serine-threonine rich protein n=1 Tax=Aspergillus versicolor CBS 583.65 TaxID=1036611 RepID=A0A1L9P803_ASPVE|nr:uncharacterized protein ASPVEDRAFT_302118 [Aspergillus versicolor CBS 583.65]OJI97638.1 hypothetical protein ASPVEDRAFT_302118 [Aspergillus versicolor CBS 583.65]
MRFLSVLSVLASASVSVLAQETATSTGTSTPKNGGSSCDAQNILDACVESIQEQVDACGPNEWDCLCEQTNNMLTCYNNCPNDGSRTGIQQQRISYCNAAGTLSTSSTRPATKTATATSDASSTSDGAAASATADDAASRLEIGLGAGFGVGLAVLGSLV